MTELERTTRRTIEFAHPFVLDKSEGEMAPGRYEVETEEALIPGLSFIAYRRVRTTMVSPAAGQGSMAQRQILTIDPVILEAALARDLQRSVEGTALRTSLPGAQRADLRDAAPNAVQTPASVARSVIPALGPRLQTNALISSAPVLIPVVIVAGLLLITWYRPGAQGTPLAPPSSLSGAATPAR